MNNRSESSIDWLELDRLVDGRLSDDDYRQLLCQIDADPDGWRHCAMAFLEHQALQKELGAFADDPACDLMAMGPLADDELEPDLEPAGLVRERSQSGMIGWLSMAACIVGGLALGFTLQSDFSDNLKRAEPVEIFAGDSAVYHASSPNQSADLAADSIANFDNRDNLVRRGSAARRSSPQMKERMKEYCPDCPEYPPCLPYQR